ncbi:MAG TPA: AAA family ATPase, partial [Acidimicrobiales bacterium]|nr:AAA family ATPase [Acidimicrobiales bacterium]
LAGALGLGGRHRRAGSTSERARLAVTKAIRSTLRKLAQADPELGRHLERTVRTGTFCSYSPDPALGVEWRDDVAHEAAGTPTIPASRAAERAFVGRPLERAVVHELVAATAAGRGGLLLVRGEAGIGKTRLAEEAVGEARQRGMRALVGRCVESETALPWLPLVEVLEQLLGGLPDEEVLALLGRTGPEVAKVLPSLRRRFPDLPPPVDLPAEQSRLLLYTTVRDLVLRLGTAQPAVVVLDDVHWADPATLNMLEHLADGVQAARVLVIATYRSDEVALGTPLARTVEHLVRHPACASLDLGPLGPPEVAELVAGLVGRVPPAEVAARLCTDADGNPFFVEQLLKHLAAEERLYDGHGELRADLATQSRAVPEGLRLLLGHRLHRLSRACRQVVDFAAVIGRDVDAEVLTAVAGRDEDDVLASVEEALAAGVLVARAEEDRVGFSHALLREAALAEMSSIRRRRLHGQVAEALRSRYGEDPDRAAEIADQLERAGTGVDVATTVRFLELAGRRSVESAAYEDAAARFRRAL